jgi:hypothetical protein
MMEETAFFGGFWFMVAIGAVALFTFLAVTTWSENRAKERSEYYRHETYKKLAEQPSDQGAQVLEVMRTEERIKHRKMLEGIKLGGLVTTFVGIGLGVMLYTLAEPEVAAVGLVPLGVGLALLLYATILAPRDVTELPGPRDDSSRRR